MTRDSGIDDLGYLIIVILNAKWISGIKKRMLFVYFKNSENNKIRHTKIKTCVRYFKNVGEGSQ